MAASQRSAGTVTSRLPASRTAELRAVLEAEGTKRAADLAQHAQALAALTDPSGDTTGRDRAIAALHMYCARASIEEIDAALARIESGVFGICLSCGQPIPFEHLEKNPQARLCAACPAPASPRAEGQAEPRRGPSRGEQAGDAPLPGSRRLLAAPSPSAGLARSEGRT